MQYCRKILRDLLNCDDDHISDHEITLAKEELKAILFLRSNQELELAQFLDFMVSKTGESLWEEDDDAS